MLVIVIFLVLAITSKSSQTYKDVIVSNIYEKNISFPKIKKWYNKYLKGIVPLEQEIINETPVFNEQLEYTNESIYHDGVKLEVIDNYYERIIKPTEEENFSFIKIIDEFGNEK